MRIVQQFREAHNMTYELDCTGSPLIVRVFPMNGESATPTSEWKIEARVSNAADAVVASATAPTRALALTGVAQWWSDNAATYALGSYDWNAIAEAMTTVRAI